MVGVAEVGAVTREDKRCNENLGSSHVDVVIDVGVAVVVGVVVVEEEAVGVVVVAVVVAAAADGDDDGGSGVAG